MQMRLLPLVAIVALAACQDVTDPSAPRALPETPSLAVLDDEAVIVRLRDDVSDPAAAARGLVNAHRGQLGFVYRHALKGFSARIPVAAQAALARNPQVVYVEPDGPVFASRTTQNNATWGLDRIDQRARPIDGKYNYDFTGSGIDAYIFDTGIRYDHTDFGGRAVFGSDQIGGDGSDCNGHGTHVAGTVGGTTYGVAKGVRLIAVRVLNCSGSGSWSGVAAGVDWAVGHHNQATRRAVGNMSLGGGANTTVDDAVRRAIADGITMALAAGNSSANACNYSPARVSEAITVGSTTSSDARSSFSNYGNCVDLFAPGSSITSAWHTGSSATNTISGTSMASPHVAGAAALYLAEFPSSTPQQVRDGLYNRSTKGIVTSSNSTNNHLLYTLADDGGEPPPPPPSGFTLSATGTKVQGRHRVTLSWAGASASTVDIFRNNGKIATVSATATPYTDNIGARGSATYTYRVCHAGTSTCSNNATVVF
jgi:subtilisin family serine protease